MGSRSTKGTDTGTSRPPSLISYTKGRMTKKVTRRGRTRKVGAWIGLESTCITRFTNPNKGSHTIPPLRVTVVKVRQRPRIIQPSVSLRPVALLWKVPRSVRTY